MEFAVIRPLNDRVVVRVIEDMETRRGSIIIPDIAQGRPQKGIVLGVGDGRVTEAGVLIPPKVGAGDRILFAKYSGSEIRINGEDLLIFKESDILAVLDPVKEET